jgi:hypothetical protein
MVWADMCFNLSHPDVPGPVAVSKSQTSDASLNPSCADRGSERGVEVTHDVRAVDRKVDAHASGCQLLHDGHNHKLRRLWCLRQRRRDDGPDHPDGLAIISHEDNCTGGALELLHDLPRARAINVGLATATPVLDPINEGTITINAFSIQQR